jgi:hypothetical protein
LPPHELTVDEKDQLVSEATSIVGQTHWEWVCREAKKFVDGNGGSWDDAKWSGFSAHIRTRHAIDDSKLGSVLEEKRSDYLLRLPNDREAIKLLAEWSKWLVTIETTVTTLIGLATASGNISIAQHPGSYWAFAAIFSFLLSVLSASFLLFSLPGVLQRLPPPQDKDVLTIGTYNGRGIPVSAFSVAQFACFGLGAFCFAMWAVLQVQDSVEKTTRLTGQLNIEVHYRPGGTGLTGSTAVVVPSLNKEQPATPDSVNVVPGRSARPSR